MLVMYSANGMIYKLGVTQRHVVGWLTEET